MLPPWMIALLAAVQDVALDRRTADVFQYLTTAGVTALIVLVYRLDHRLARVEQKLNDPDHGVVSQLQLTSRFRHWCRNKLWGYGFRLRALELKAGIDSIDETDDFPERQRNE